MNSDETLRNVLRERAEAIRECDEMLSERNAALPAGESIVIEGGA